MHVGYRVQAKEKVSAAIGVDTAALMSLYSFQDRVVDGAVDMVDIYIPMRCCLSTPFLLLNLSSQP